MRHDTNSPAPEAIEWFIGTGRGVEERRLLVPSYVVKKAPAWGRELEQT